MRPNFQPGRFVISEFQIKMAAVFCIMLVCLVRAAAGTTVIIGRSKAKVVIAADSRVTLDDRPYSDDHCKIAALRGKFIFGAAGAMTELAPFTDRIVWDATQEARRVMDLFPALYTVMPGNDLIDKIARRWAEGVKDRFQFKPGIHKKDEPAVARGFFVGINDAGELSAVLATISPLMAGSDFLLLGSYTNPVPLPDMMEFSAMGRTAVFEEFAQGKTARARREIKQWETGRRKHPAEDVGARLAIRYVELTILHDRTGTVGGAVDAIEMRKDGTIRWIQRKQSCPPE